MEDWRRTGVSKVGLVLSNRWTDTSPPDWTHLRVTQIYFFIRSFERVKPTSGPEGRCIYTGGLAAMGKLPTRVSYLQNVIFLNMANKNRAWVFTLNNPEEAWLEGVNTVPDAQYMVYQIERGEEGTTHVQGYVYFSNKRAFNGVRLLIPGAHIEPRAGTHDQARAYCMKEDSRVAGPWEFGEPPAQGKRNDIKEFVSEIKKRKVMSEQVLLEEFAPVVAKYPNFVARCQSLYGGTRSTMPIVQVFYGDPETGKSERAHAENPDAYVHTGTQWWDGYRGQQAVILDDFYGATSGISYQMFLKVCDKYPLKVQVKGGFQEFLATKIVITSNERWDTWYSDDKGFNYDAIKRRINLCIRYSKDGNVTEFDNTPLITPMPSEEGSQDDPITLE